MKQQSSKTHLIYRASYAFCLALVVLLAAALSYSTASGATAIDPDTGIVTYSCCGCTMLLLVMGGSFFLVVSIVKSGLNWKRGISRCLGVVLLGTFAYVSLPTISAALSPVHFRKSSDLLRQDCGPPDGSYADSSSHYETRLDIDGDGELERWTHTIQSSGSSGASAKAFVYEPGEFEPRWCSYVYAFNNGRSSWIRLINLDLDPSPEVWIRDIKIDGETLVTRGFVDFTRDQTRAFDPRLTVLITLLPLRALLLLIAWLISHYWPISGIAITLVTVLVYILWY